MADDRFVYERKTTDPRSWTTFSTEHLAFALHRITGWLLLGWVVVHLVVPATSSPAAVWRPTSKAVIVGLLSVALFHGFNGSRLIVAELGFGAGNTRRLFQGTVLLCALLIAVLGWSL